MIRGTVGLDNLKIICFVGVYPHEKISMQELLIDLKIETDIAKCVATDSLSDAIDYDKLAGACGQIANSRHYHLIETLADAILDGLLKEFSIDSAWIRIKKSQSVVNAEFSFVELKRTRQS